MSLFHWLSTKYRRLTVVEYPASDYISAVAELNSYDNVVTLGYVHTLYTEAALSTLEANVSTYAGWNDYTGGSNITIHGIFFDEAPYEDDETYTTYMTSAAEYATSLGLDYVVFNPGTITTVAAYYDAANLILNQEISFDDWSTSTVSDIPEEYRGQSAVMIHDFTDISDISSVVSTVVDYGIAAFYATEDCCYNAIDSTLLDDIASELVELS